MTARAVNLARKRFVNSRPVTRLVTILWLAGALLLAANLWSYYGYFIGRGASSARLLDVEQQIVAERDRLRQLESEVNTLDLAQQNETAMFLNSKISQRSFSWSRLFDRLADVLPGEVRLLSLAPQTDESDPSRAHLHDPKETVSLTLRGEAKSSEAVLRLLDALFAHEAFINPDLKRESVERGGVTFDLEAEYRPGARDGGSVSSGGRP